ncbi:MAG: ORF6N domain-containing protein [Mediterraneibacter faecis]
MIISERIFYVMEQKNITQLELSRRTGIATSNISDWKKKKTNPKADCLLSICDALEITPDQLLTGKGIDPEYKDADMDYEVTKADIRILKQIHSLGDEQYKRLMAYESIAEVGADGAYSGGLTCEITNCDFTIKERHKKLIEIVTDLFGGRMEETKELITTDDIRSKVYIIRGQQVMLDKDLAEIYGYEVKKLNQQVKRNIERFPEDFMFRLSNSEIDSVRSQIVTSRKKDFCWAGRRT